MNDSKLIELAEDVAGLKVGMASIDAKLDGLVHTLLGNGQPGVIAELRATDRAMSQRIDKGEKRTQWLAGVWAGASSVIIVVFAIVKYIFHR